MHKSWAKVTVITFQRVTSTSPLFSLFLACTYIHTTMHVEIHLSHLYIVSTVYEAIYGEKKQTNNFVRTILLVETSWPTPVVSYIIRTFCS